MISDKLNNSLQYQNVHAGFSKAFNFIEKAVNENFSVGRYEIDGDRIFAFIQEYTSKQDSLFEAHRNYIDIQFIVNGTEVMYVADIDCMKIKTEYDVEKDVMFFENYDNASKLVLNSGEYGIFFPWDSHMPGLCLDDEPGDVKKIVVKVKYSV